MKQLKCYLVNGKVKGTNTRLLDRYYMIVSAYICCLQKALTSQDTGEGAATPHFEKVKIPEMSCFTINIFQFFFSGVAPLTP